ncbi:MAG: hypothetical protein IPF87_12860 [Gemmatimonadetes bacterium]|nr:hypothetical protein [Gemmatimonadota bacterium]MBK6843127.1 hypothetical protein [Gemmatimonadota bacterium]MBK8059768.1 hypothetical protein [Gemmatimonadota bacterium]
MAGNAADLERAIAMYIAHEIGFDEFEVLFSELFLNRVPEGELSNADLDRYGDVNEKLMWTSLAPSAEERDLGWIDREQFRKWLTCAGDTA